MTFIPGEGCGDTGIEEIVESANPTFTKMAASRLETAGDKLINHLVGMTKYAYKPRDLVREFQALVPILDEFDKALASCQKAQIPDGQFAPLLKRIREAKQEITRR
jgi:hypothetical protein